MRFSTHSSLSRFWRAIASATFLVAPAITSAQEIDLTFPFLPEGEFRCTQGPGGDFSHAGDLTKFAIDLAAPRGTPVIAAADGVAHTFFDVLDPAFSVEDCPQATSGSFGNYVTVDHGGGLFTLYAHLASVADGIDGQQVFGGRTELGTVNSTGYSCGSHLHFALHAGNPERLLESTPIPITRIRAREAPDGQSELLSGDEFKCGPNSVGAFYAAAVADQPLVLSDDFEDNDLIGWDFVTWGTHTGTAEWGLASDGSTVLRLAGGTVNGGGNTVGYRTDFSGDDYTISARVKVVEVRNGGQHSAIVARYSDYLNFYELTLNRFQGDIRLIRWQNGNAMTIGPATSVPGAWFDDWIELKLEVTGEQLRGYANGQLFFDVSDATLRAGSAGVMNAGSVTHFDDFEIRAEAGNPPSLVPDTLVAIDVLTDELLILEETSGTRIVVGPLDVEEPSGLAYDRVSDKLYTFDNAQDEVVELDKLRGTTLRRIGTSGASLGNGVRDLTFGPGNILFAITNHGGSTSRLNRINLETGLVEEVGPLLGPQLDGLAFDPESGSMYVVKQFGSGALYEIDPSSGSLVFLGFGGQISDVHRLADRPNTTVLYAIKLQSSFGASLGTVPAPGVAFSRIAFVGPPGSIQGIEMIKLSSGD